MQTDRSKQSDRLSETFRPFQVKTPDRSTEICTGYAACGILASWNVIRPDAEAGTLAAPVFPKNKGKPKPRESLTNNKNTALMA